MEISLDWYVGNARGAWEQGFAYVAMRLNLVLAKRAGSLRVEAPPPPASSTLKEVKQRFLNALIGVRPFSTDLPSDYDLPLWSLGYINGSNNHPILISLGGPNSSDNDVASMLAFLEGREWPEEVWRENIVE